MERKLVLVFVFLLTLAFSCTNDEPTKRKPSSVELGKIDLIENAKRIQEDISSNKIDSKNCQVELNKILNIYKNVTPATMDSQQVAIDGKIILDETFNARLSLHSLLGKIPSECQIKIKDIFLAMRATEDMTGVVFYKDEQISADSIKYADEATPVFEAQKYRPYHLGSGINPSEKFTFKNGDIMITKGISFVSSTISELATPKSLFSHIVFVHVDEKTNETVTIESYVGKGVGIYPIEDALRNENARILILRSKDSEMANKAANYMYERVMTAKAKGKVILYDYDLDFAHNDKLSCEEVAYDAFNTTTNGKVILPELMSEIKLVDDKFLSRVGVKKGSMMVPADMETDSRFDIALDWTDYRVMRDSWRKDTVLAEMFRWSDDYKYQIHENLTSIAARLIWDTRYIPGVWGMLSKISGIPTDFTKDVPGKTIATMASLKTIGGLMLPILTKADQEHFKASGNWMSLDELKNALEKYRIEHPKDLEKVYRP